MIETNATKSIAFARKGLRWALIAGFVGAMVGSFAGCVTTSDTVYDDKGPCLSGKLTIRDSRYQSYTIDDTHANRSAVKEQGYTLESCDRRADVNEKSARENERALVGAVAGAVGGVVLGGSLPLLAAAWFFFLTLLGQMFSAVRAEPIRSRHQVTIDRKNAKK